MVDSLRSIAAKFGEARAESPDQREQLADNVMSLLAVDRRNQLRIIEAMLFAAEEPLDLKTMAEKLPPKADIAGLVSELREMYTTRGVQLMEVNGRWMFRTADDLAYLMHREDHQQRALSRAALETMAIIAYHQPVTRAEIEDVRGVSISKGTLDLLLETGWVRMRGRRRTPGRPVTYGTTDEFLMHFGLENLVDLPGLDDLKAAGLLSSQIPADFVVPVPGDLAELDEDEDPLDGDELEQEDGQAVAGDVHALNEAVERLAVAQLHRRDEIALDEEDCV